MSEPTGDAISAVITPRHYRALCGMALAAIVLIQQQTVRTDAPILYALHGLLLAVGAIALFGPVRVSPAPMLIVLATPYLIERWLGATAPSGSTGFFELGDAVVCMAALTYVIGHYRLLGLQSGVLPADRRLQADATMKKLPPNVRSEQSLSPAELATLIFIVPSFALLAQIATRLLHRPRFLDIDPRIHELLVFLWILLPGMFFFAHAFRCWKRLQMDRTSALLVLYDALWHETRGEQRRIQRWRLWWKLRG
jgi:hypothetical protein